MSGRSLAISQRQVEALAKGAAKAHCRVEIKIGNTVVTVIPNNDSPKSSLIENEEEINL